MDNLKDLMKKVKVPAMPAEKGVNVKALKKELEEKMNEKAKVYGFIGMEVYDLSKEGKIEIPQIKNYFDKMDEINLLIEDLENRIKEQEIKNAGKNVCSCGYKLKANDRFCPNCGEIVPRNTVLCFCGTELEKDAKFCRTCGKRMEDILALQDMAKQPAMKECICGAKVPVGQFMCLECGRKME